MTSDGGLDRVRFFDDLVRVETRLYNALSERLRPTHGITLAQFEFLRFIGRADDTRVADLAHAFAVGVGATSKGVDRLEGAGWVTRVPNPRNRRSSLLVLTPAGRRLVRESAVTFAAALDELLGEHAVAPAAALFAALRPELEDARLGTPAG